MADTSLLEESSHCEIVFIECLQKLKSIQPQNMTNEQTTALRNFEARIRQLMMAYKAEQQENARLRQQLDVCKQKLDEAQENVCRLEENYKALKTARMIEVSGDDVRESKARIAHLIREVDKCIALLDV